MFRNIRERKIAQIPKLLPFFGWQILQCLTVQGLNSSGGGGDNSGNSSGLSRAMVKDRFKTFNIQFEELHQRQSQWTVPDSELRESLRLAVAEVLLPAYRSFIKRFGHVTSHLLIFLKQHYLFFLPTFIYKWLLVLMAGL